MARTKEQILQAIVTARDQFLASIWGRDVRRGMGDIADAVYDAVVNQLLVLDETLTQNGSGADAAAVGNALNAINATISGDEDIIADLSLKTPSNFGVLPSGSVNLTNPPYALIGNAFFVLSSDNSYTDTPLNTSFNGILLQLNYQNNSGKKIQLLAATNGKIFIRVYDTGAWGSWNGFDGDVSIDSTLTVANAAADAKATGDALATKANISSLAAVATSGDYDDLSNKPVIAAVATSGSYNDLSDKPNIPAVDATLNTQGAAADAKATGDAIGDLRSSIPTIDPTLTIQGGAADAKATGDALAAKANTSALSPVAFSGSYNDLSNKPALAAVATSGSYNDLSDKPNIPAVDATLMIDGAAADAKATGDAISTARSEVMAAIPMIDTTLSTQGDAADAKATGDAISTARSELMAAITTAMRNMGVLPNGEALGSIGSPDEPNQIYLLVSANSYTGVPTELTTPFNALLLNTSRWETVDNSETCTLARQVLFAESGEVFIRCYDANALDEHGAPVGWTQWRKSVVSVDATLTTQGAAADAYVVGELIQSVDTKATFAFNRGLTALGTLSNNSDFNNLVGKSHIYRLSQLRTYINAPVNTGFAGWLIKTYYDDGQGTVEHGQIVFADSGEIYTRYNSGASWGSWATVANKTTIDATLSTSGAAADAAVVGTELAALKADYVVENGTSGNWTWRKWNSGILEMWGYHLSVRFDTTADGEVNWRQAGSTGFSWASGSFNFPQTFYDKTYTMNISKEYDPDAQSSNLLIYGSVHQSTSQGGVRVLIPTDQTTGLNTTRLDVHVSGRWKA